MTYKSFNNYLNEIFNGNDAMHNHHEKSSEQRFLNNGRWALHFLEKHFKDRHRNLLRWLNGKPCVFKSDKTGEMVEISVGKDREAIYLFLIFCKNIEEKNTISEEFRDYLALVITRSRTPDEDWEEC